MPTHVLLALASAVSWGASDFLGGLTERRAAGTSVAFASQLVGLVALLATAPLVAGSAGAGDLAWGAAAGVGGSVGVALLYHGLAVGLMSVVAPLTAVGAASLPVVFGLLTGERPGPAPLTGVVLALVAVAVLCASPGPDGPPPDAPAEPASPGRHRAGLVAGLLSGAGFGVFFICLGRTADGAGLWPLVAARVSSVTLLAVIGLSIGRALVPRGVASGVVAVGLLDVTANVCYLLATRRGLLSVVALLASLYPAATVLMARLVLRERLSRVQAAGLAGAGAAVALIALG